MSTPPTPDAPRHRPTPLGNAVVAGSATTEFDRLTSLAAELTGAACAMLTLVEHERVVHRSLHVRPGTLPSPRTLPHERSLGARVVRSGEPLVVEDARACPELAGHPSVTEWEVVAYAGLPIRLEDGTVAGVLAIADGAPRAWDQATLHGLRAVATLATKEVALGWHRTAQADAERALVESERFRDTLLDASPDCVEVLDTDGRRRSMNASGLALMDVGDFAAIEGSDWVAAWPGEERAKARAAVRDALAGGQGRFVGCCPSLRGTLRWWDVAVTPVRGTGATVDRLLVVSRDVTELRRADRALRESEARYRTLVESSHAGVCAVDCVGRITFANARLGALLGRTPAALQGMSFFDLVDPDEAHAARTRFARRQRGVAEEVDMSLRRADGSLLVVQKSTSSLFDAEGQFTGAIYMMSDVTESRALAAQLRQAQKLEAVGRLAGGVAHDINNLVQVISACATLIGEELPAGSDAREDLTEVENAARRAAQLTRQLLAFSRRQQLQPRRIAVDAVVADVEHMLRRLVGADVEVRVATEPGVPPVLADRGQLEQVIVNLAINARDAMPVGGCLTIATRTVTVSERDAAADPELAAGTWVALEVADTGHGMDDATRARVFEPFFTTKEQGKGTGLGLATVYGIVRQSGGTVQVLSAPGEGATFRVLLPCAGEAAGAEVLQR